MTISMIVGPVKSLRTPSQQYLDVSRESRAKYDKSMWYVKLSYKRRRRRRIHRRRRRRLIMVVGAYKCEWILKVYLVCPILIMSNDG